MFGKIVILLGFLIGTHTAFAQDREKALGIWKLVSLEIEYQTSGERRIPYGKDPKGYIIFTPEGRMMTVITGEGRKPAKTDEDRAQLLRTMFAYTGTYRFEGDKFVTKVDASWNEAWTGTEQVRFYKIAGNRLEIISAWAPATNEPGEPQVRGLIVWERAQ